MPASKARSILICAAIIVAVPALAQVQPSVVAGVARTVATTRIDQPATLTSSQDLAFIVQSPVAAALNLAQLASTSTRLTTAVATVGTTTGVRSSSAQTVSAAASAPNGSSLLRGASPTVSAAVPTVAQATFTVA
ncbi:MAG: hypothetical protein Q7J32_06655, partial [Sphingomonadaceae bacterium]|nr:hypothetical protein [Sphingomonadaceae bacterium]